MIFLPPDCQLPVPIGDAIYSYADELWKVHLQIQHCFKEEAKLEPTKYLKTHVPLNRFVNLAVSKVENILTEVILPVQCPEGRPIIALEPHPDDLILSVSGTLAKLNRPLYVITVFSRALTMHPYLDDKLNVDQVAVLRHEENSAALGFFLATQFGLGLADASPPYQAPDTDTINSLVNDIERLLENLPDAELLAPACVTRHPDHVIARLAAEKLGCRWYWEDVGFFPTYARAVADREYFQEHWAHGLIPNPIDITDVAMFKFAILTLFRSQCPVEWIDGVLRYNWAVAHEVQREMPLTLPETSVYAERMYRTYSV